MLCRVVLYCIVLFCVVVQRGIIRYCTLLIMCCTVLYYTVLYCTVSYCTALSYNAVQFTDRSSICTKYGPLLFFISTTYSAVQFLHTRGVIHRDIKPELLMVKTINNNNDLILKVTDLGFALIETNTSNKPSKLLIGTPG